MGGVSPAVCDGGAARCIMKANGVKTICCLTECTTALFIVFVARPRFIVIVPAGYPALRRVVIKQVVKSPAVGFRQFSPPVAAVTDRVSWSWLSVRSTASSQPSVPHTMSSTGPSLWIMRNSRCSSSRMKRMVLPCRSS